MWRSIMFGPKKLSKLRQYLHRSNSTLTCYVSNLGHLKALPPAVIAFDATPTLQHADVPLGLMVYTFNNRLRITAGYDERRLPADSVARLVERVVDEITSIFDARGDCSS
jgi:hypothetical protein